MTPSTSHRSRLSNAVAAGAEFVIVAAGLAIPLVVLGAQAFIWLRQGFWAPITLESLGAPIPQTGWLGVDKMIHWTFAEPSLATISFIVGAVAFWLKTENDKD